MTALHPCQHRHLPDATCFRNRMHLAAMPDVEPAIDGEAEENAALGLLCENRIALADCGLSEADFTGTRKTVFRGLARLAQQGRPLDLIALAGELKDNGELARIGGPAFLAGLVESAPIAANYDYHRDRLSGVSKKRHYAAAGERLAALANKPGIPPEALQVCVSDLLRHVTENDAGTMPEAVPLAALVTPAPDAADELLRTRFLCRGGAAFLVAQSGRGKSSLCRQMAVAWAAGLPAFGITPARPLAQLIIQAENDAGDEAAFRDGIRAAGIVPPGQIDEALRRVLILQCQDAAGPAFLARLGILLTKHRPDLIWVDPLLSFLGGDVNRQDVVSAFLRNGLQPILTRHNCAAMIAHHTPKPLRMKAGESAADVGAYLGAGSAELINWPRAVFTLELTPEPGTFKLKAHKRPFRLGWENDAGERVDHVFIRHATDGRIYWQAADAPEEADTGTRKRMITPEDCRRLLADQGPMLHNRLRDTLATRFDCGERTAKSAIKHAVEAGTIRKTGGAIPHYETV